MVERLLLDWVDAEARRAAVGGEHHFAAFHLAHEAQAPLPLVQLAVARTQVALHAPVGEAVPPATRMVRHSFHLVTLYRQTRQRPSRTWSGSPALRASSGRNSRLSGMLSHTCGRNVARRPSASRMMPSSPARIWASRSSSSAKRIGFGAESSDTSTLTLGHSAAVTGGKRGSRNAAAIAFS